MGKSEVARPPGLAASGLPGLEAPEGNSRWGMGREGATRTAQAPCSLEKSQPNELRAHGPPHPRGAELATSDARTRWVCVGWGQKTGVCIPGRRHRGAGTLPACPA